MSIRRKIFRMILVTAIVVGAVMFLTSTVQSQRTEKFVESVNKQNIESVSQYTKKNLDDVSSYIISSMSTDYAQRIGQNFSLFENTVISIANYTQDLYLRPAPANPAGAPESLVMPGVDFAAVEDEFYRLYPIVYYMKSLNHFRNEPGVDMYVLTESGLYFDGTGIKGTGVYPRELRARGWYTGAVRAGGIYWADVYVGATTGERMITCSYPVYLDGQLMGVAAIDIPIQLIGSLVLAVNNQYVDGVCIYCDDGVLEFSVDGNSIEKQYLADRGDELHRFFLENEGEVYVTSYQDGSVALIPVENTSWVVAVFFRFDAVEQAADDIVGVMEANDTTVSETFDERLLESVIILMLVLAAAIVAAVFYARSRARLLVRPIERLLSVTKEVGAGNLDYEAPIIRSGDELEDIQVAFGGMTASLKGYVRNLETVTAEKERVETELAVATQIQKSMLPNLFPPFPIRREFDIFAVMQPARQVGGDFYDFFLIDDNHIALVVADVSGKGIPAALFMVVAKTVLKNIAQTGAAPDEILEKANDTLCSGNDADMFVTAFLCILEIDTGRLCYANAGHNPPVLINADGSCTFLPVTRNLVLAGLAGTQYRRDSARLLPGQRLLLYTDGVTEAFNPGGEQYGNGRLLAAAADSAKTGQDIKEAIHSLRADIDRFADGEEQADDITMLLLRYDGGADDGTVQTFAANTAELPQLMHFVEDTARAAGCDGKTVMHLALVAEEVFVNIAHYAYSEAGGTVHVACSVRQGPRRVLLEFRDSGHPFDPTAKPDPDITLAAEEREAGGLGIFLAKKIMDTTEYRRENEENILRMEKLV